MAVSTRLIRRRIRSVTNTKKITKAMEMVAASKMRRAISAVLATRPYAEAAWQAIKDLAEVTDPRSHPLLAKREEVKRSLLILFTSDRGLCGGFNAQMLKTAAEFLRAELGEADIAAVGKRGQGATMRTGRKIVAAFIDLTNNARVTDVRPIADIAIGEFTRGVYDRVYLGFTDFRSVLSQKPVVKQLLPIVRIEGLGDVTEAIGGARAAPTAEKSGGYEYLFEPSPEKVLDMMLPRLVEVQIYQALLESSASEHSARMVAMRSATDAAGDMIDGLTLTYNQARQAGITREIAEISSGKAALE